MPVPQSAVPQSSVPQSAATGVTVALSTASVYPEPVTVGFELAADLGYDGVEVMVWNDPVSQDPAALARLAEHYGIPVVAVHAPCLLITQRVWGNDPWRKLERATDAAELLGATTVVVHPPFRWQRDYAREFAIGVERLSGSTEVAIAVENMFPWRARGREVAAYAPDWNPVGYDYRNVTLDLSHTAVSGSDALAMADELGDRLAHVHLADGTGTAKDEHLVPGRGNQPCAELLRRLVKRGYHRSVVLEINTRRAVDRDQRTGDLAAALTFARLHLAADTVT
jgi:sugar phosphate isomerase/epimerase